MPRLSEELPRLYPEPQYDHLEEALDRAEAACISINRASEVSPVAKIPYKARDLLQRGLRRNLELAAAFIASFNAKLFTPLFVLGRAAVETGCLMWEFYSRIKNILDTRDKDALIDFDQRVMNALFGAKSNAWVGDPEVYPALNILTIIDRQAKDAPELRNFYDVLSEFSHPNSAGMQQTYALDRPELRETHFADRPFDNEADGLYLPINALILGISQGVFAVEMFESRLVAFSGLCEEAIHDGGTWPADLPFPLPRG